MKKVLFIICTIFISVSISGCFSSGNVRIKGQTQASLEKTLIKGKTTKAEVLEKFGKALHVGRSKNGEEF